MASYFKYSTGIFYKGLHTDSAVGKVSPPFTHFVFEICYAVALFNNQK